MKGEKEDRLGPHQNVLFRDFGGLKAVLEMTWVLIRYPLLHPNSRVEPPIGVLAGECELGVRLIQQSFLDFVCFFSLLLRDLEVILRRRAISEMTWVLDN